MKKFTSNPLSGYTIENRDRWQDKAGIYDAQGNKVLDRQGTDWSENDQMGYDMLMKSMDYQYQADLLNYQNEYNSPAEQAKRLREAGINPDLQQIQNSPSASSSATAPSTQLNEGAETARKLNLAKSFFDYLPQAMKMYTDMKGDLLRIQNMEQEQLLLGAELARSDFSQSISSSWFDDKGKLKAEILDNPMAYVPSGDHFVKHNGKPSRFEKAYFNEIQRLVNTSSENLSSLRYSKSYDSSKYRAAYLDILGRHGFSMKDDDLVNLLREYNKTVYETSKKRNEKDKLNAENDFIPELLAKANKKIDSEDKGDQFVGYMLYFLASIMQGNFSVGRSSDPKGSSKSFGFSF